MMHIAERLRTTPDPGAHAPPSHAVTAADCGLLLLRITVGLVMAGHGCQKLFGIFGGNGLTATGKGFEALGYHPGTFYAVLGGLSEFLGGLGLALGLFTPLAAAALIAVMINAMVTVTAAHGLWAMNGGLEYTMCIAAVALAVAAIGPGRLSLDRPFPWGKGGWEEAGIALGLAGVGSAIVLSL
ncbi:DoxX family protein [Streptomyces sp. NPDC088354]|uniref:DoxX family protein n=1 Tax=unclassified Streptomyces TaxID=2593676 RepID=UPI0029AF0834|nr:DoxX family protein [Streptomyces sp. MI02-7b]MDX3076814.1 DoxX family protein [Streptomyces sp. MI02-7b]